MYNIFNYQVKINMTKTLSEGAVLLDMLRSIKPLTLRKRLCTQKYNNGEKNKVASKICDRPHQRSVYLYSVAENLHIRHK